MNEIFISHCGLDDRFCSLFVDGLKSCGCNKDNIFYTSRPENGVIYKLTPEIKEVITNSKINVIFLSKNYLNSPYCCSEMGALAISSTPSFVFAIGDTNHNDLNGLIGKDPFVRSLESEDDIIFAISSILQKLNLPADASEAHTQSKCIISRYKSIKESATRKQDEKKSYDISKLLNIINALKEKNIILDEANKKLNDKLNYYNKIANIDTKRTVFVKTHQTKNNKQIPVKPIQIAWGELFFVIFAGQPDEKILKSKLFSFEDRLSKNKNVHLDKDWIDSYVQELKTLHLITQTVTKENPSSSVFGSFASAFCSTYEWISLTPKGQALLDQVTLEKTYKKFHLKY